MNYVYLKENNYIIPDGQNKLNKLNTSFLLSHTVRDLCEMRDENNVWNDLFVYDDIENLNDYMYCNLSLICKQFPTQDTHLRIAPIHNVWSSARRSECVLRRSVHNYNTRNKDKPRLAIAKHAYRDRDFRLVGVHVWNDICNNIKIATSFSSFKKILKLYYI